MKYIRLNDDKLRVFNEKTHSAKTMEKLKK